MPTRIIEYKKIPIKNTERISHIGRINRDVGLGGEVSTGDAMGVGVCLDAGDDTFRNGDAPPTGKPYVDTVLLTFGMPASSRSAVPSKKLTSSTVSRDRSHSCPTNRILVGKRFGEVLFCQLDIPAIAHVMGVGENLLVSGD